MQTQVKLLIVTAIVLAVTATSAQAVQVSLSSVGVTNQTTVYSGQLSGLGLTSIETVVVTDLDVGGGSNGVFSGFDLDFILLDADGDLSTVGDQILPYQTAETTISPGYILNQAGSSYKPVPPAFPGDLFGLNADNTTIDFARATIGTLDATYNDPLSVVTSDGWVSLGFGGSLSAKFDTTLIGSSMWIFIGEVGPTRHGNEEEAGITVDFCPVVPAPGAIFLGMLGTSLVTWMRRRRVIS